MSITWPRTQVIEPDGVSVASVEDRPCTSVASRAAMAGKLPSAAMAQAAVTLVAAKVVATRDDGTFDVDIAGEGATARLGFGCLLRPIPGDRVLLSLSGEAAHILTVLERLIADRATLALPSGGALEIGVESLNVTARRGIAIDAATVHMRARRFGVVADTLTLFGKVASWIAGQMHISADTQETVADIISTRAVERSARVTSTDVLQAGSLVQRVDSLAATTADTAVIATKEDLRFDGKRVSVG
jgi:hypothetical protein